MTGFGPLDPADVIAGVAITGWQRLLRIHHHRLKRADLEDCLGQATLELLAAAAHGQQCADSAAIRAALDQRFQSRIIDRQRALGGRSPITASLHHATALDAITETVGTAAGDPLARVLEREQLARLTSALGQLTPDQRLVLRSQISGQERPAQFCARHGWSVEKYRKTAQRARAKLRRLAG
jgi:DNA-directed RNA polymerase specialized sigma24 family protein